EMQVVARNGGVGVNEELGVGEQIVDPPGAGGVVDGVAQQVRVGVGPVGRGGGPGPQAYEQVVEQVGVVLSGVGGGWPVGWVAEVFGDGVVERPVGADAVLVDAAA